VARKNVRGLIALSAAGHGLALLPAPVLDGVAGVHPVPVTAPRLVHRTEALYGAAPAGPAAAFLAELERTEREPPPD
jgi:hypothetical protein